MAELELLESTTTTYLYEIVCMHYGLDAEYVYFGPEARREILAASEFEQAGAPLETLWVYQSQYPMLFANADPIDPDEAHTLPTGWSPMEFGFVEDLWEALPTDPGVLEESLNEALGDPYDVELSEPGRQTLRELLPDTAASAGSSEWGILRAQAVEALLVHRVALRLQEALGRSRLDRAPDFSVRAAVHDQNAAEDSPFRALAERTLDRDLGAVLEELGLAT